MTISKKSSRKIIINDNVFRWKFNPKKEHTQGTIAIQLDERQSCKLIVILPDWRDPWFNPYDQKPNCPEQVTPSFVRLAIESSVELGWNIRGNGVFQVKYNSATNTFIT